MSRQKPLVEILQTARRLSPTIHHAQWYGFGSFFLSEGAVADIDVLLVCRDAPEAIRLRAETAELCERWPLHLLIMTKAEAAATNFVAAQGCRPLRALEV